MNIMDLKQDAIKAPLVQLLRSQHDLVGASHTCSAFSFTYGLNSFTNEQHGTQNGILCNTFSSPEQMFGKALP